MAKVMPVALYRLLPWVDYAGRRGARCQEKKQLLYDYYITINPIVP